MATTFGNLTAGSQFDEMFAGFKEASSYVLTEPGNVSKLTIDCDGLGSAGAGNATIRGIIYADSGGLPGVLLAQSSDVVITHTGAGTGQARAWVDLVFGTPVTLQAGTYWLGVCHIAGVSQAPRWWAAFASGHGLTKSGAISDPWGTPSTTIDEDIAVYATYAPAGAAKTFQAIPFM